ncbi:hypothetical protein DRQ36_10280, partial [bacterium]
MFCPMQDVFLIEEEPRKDAPTLGRKSLYALEYDVNRDRGLCGRGNFCQELATHPSRLFRAKKGVEYSTVEKVASDFAANLQSLSGEKIAIMLDGSLTLEETAKALALAEKIGTKLVALSPAEDIAVAPFKNSFTFEDVSRAVTNVVIGDVMTLSPTITKLLHDARALERGYTIIAIDTVKSRTGWFAHPELITPIGKTTELISAISETIESKRPEDKSLENIGISPGDFDWTVSAIEKASGKGNIIVAPGWHFADAFGVCAAAKKLAETAKLKFGVLPLTTNSRGIYRLLANAGCDIAGTYKALYNGELDALLAIDCDPLESLPKSKIPKIFGLTGQLPTDSYEKVSHFIPSTFLFEKTGTLLGTEEGIIELNEKINGPGVLGAGEIIDKIFSGEAPVPDNLRETVLNFEEPKESPVAISKIPKAGIIGVGQGHVFHHSDGRYTRRTNFINLHDAENVNAALVPIAIADRLGIKNGDRIRISSESGNAE